MPADPASKACVIVGPPLNASGPRSGTTPVMSVACAVNAPSSSDAIML